MCEINQINHRMPFFGQSAKQGTLIKIENLKLHFTLRIKKD